jgi:hypothetical protein
VTIERFMLARVVAANARRIVAQALGVVHVLISSKAAEYRLPQQADQRRPFLPVRASASISPANAVNPSASSSSR